MKKTIFLAAVAVSLLATTTFESVANEKVMVETTEEVTYSEIEVKDLPEAVVESIKVDYAGGVISKAYKGSDSSYKVEINANSTDHEVFYNKEGKKIEHAK